MVDSVVPVLDSKVMVRCLGRLESTGLISLTDDTVSSSVFAEIHVREKVVYLHNMDLTGLILSSSRLEGYVLIISDVNWSQTLFLRRSPLRCTRIGPDFKTPSRLDNKSDAWNVRR